MLLPTFLFLYNTKNLTKMMEQIAKSLFYPNFKNQQKIGAEVEFFIVYKKTRERLYISRNKMFFRDFFNFLVNKEGFERSKKSKTIIFINDDFGTISFEPGSQIEFASNPADNPQDLQNSIQNFFVLFDRFIHQYSYKNVTLYSKGYYTGGEAKEEIPMLRNERYALVHDYFSQFGDFADDMMKCTCALQLHFDYSSLPDLVKKVNRMLMAQPILLYLSSNSMSKKHKCHSFRRKVWESADPSRSGTPAGEEIYEQGSWNLYSYIEKILAAPRIFPLKPEWNFMENLDHHISILGTDVRIRKTIEIRYLDLPKEDSLFPLIDLTYSLIYDDELWEEFESILPYKFEDVPKMVRQINEVEEHTNLLWEHEIAAPLSSLLKEYAQKQELDFSPLIQKIANYKTLTRKSVQVYA